MYNSEMLSMKGKVRTELSTIKWACYLNERKVKTAKDCLGLEPISLGSISKGSLK